jgi:sulfur-oxidizing protein SoxX
MNDAMPPDVSEARGKGQRREMGYGRNLSRTVHLWARSWLYTACVGTFAVMLAFATTGHPGPGGDGLVRYRIIGGAIPEPLTDQPGDPERGRRIALDREGGDCTICHAMPLPQRQFHGTIGPPLDDVGRRYNAGELRLRLVDAKRIMPESIMPAYYKIDGLQRVLERYQGKPILTAQQIEDVVAYLLTLRQQ